MAKKSFYLLFNKTSKVFMGQLDYEKDIAPSNFGDNILVKKVSYDPEKEFWFGDAETGEIKKIADKPVIDQRVLRNVISNVILNEYSIFDQLNIVMEQLQNLPDEVKTESFKKMSNRISEIRQSYRDQKKVYSENSEAYIWISEEDLIEVAKKHGEGFTK